MHNIWDHLKDKRRRLKLSKDTLPSKPQHNKQFKHATTSTETVAPVQQPQTGGAPLIHKGPTNAIYATNAVTVRWIAIITRRTPRLPRPRERTKGAKDEAKAKAKDEAKAKTNSSDYNRIPHQFTRTILPRMPFAMQMVEQERCPTPLAMLWAVKTA